MFQTNLYRKSQNTFNNMLPIIMPFMNKVEKYGTARQAKDDVM